MWPIPPLKQDIISFSFFPDSLICSWIKKSNTTTAPLHFAAYERHLLNNPNSNNLTLFNPTHIKKIIHNFLSAYKLHNAFAVISLNGKPLSEEFIPQPTTNPHATDFGIKPSSNVLWGYQFMYHDDNGQSIFYLYKIPRFLILQYQLLAISAQLNLVAITTNHCALLSTHKAIFGPALRQSQFALDMMQNNNDLLPFISLASLQKLITLPPHNSTAEEFSYCATAYGLFINQGLQL